MHAHRGVSPIVSCSTLHFQVDSGSRGGGRAAREVTLKNVKTVLVGALLSGAVVGHAFGAVARRTGSEGIGFNAQVKERFEARTAQRKAAQAADPHGLTQQIFSKPVLDALSTSNAKARAEFHIEVDSLGGGFSESSTTTRSQAATRRE